MYIWSDKLTRTDLFDALPEGVWIWHMTTAQRPRKRSRAYEVNLIGSSKYNAGATNSYGEKAATWDEWGIWIARLFDIDRNAIIGPYKGRKAFLDYTRDERDRVRRNFPADSYYATTHQAPWLRGQHYEPVDSVTS